MTHQETDMNEADNNSDKDVRRLLELVGPRSEPPAALRERVHAHVLQTWQDLPEHAPTERRPWAGYAIAASLVAALVGYFSFMQLTAPGNTHVAEVIHTTGAYTVRGSATGAKYIDAGSMVRTSGEGRLFVQMASGVTVRFDTETRATIHGQSEIWLFEGGLYIDADGADQQMRVVAGDVDITDIGTLFEVRLAEELVVAVREGRVEIAFDVNSAQAHASDGMGEVVTMRGLKEISREQVATTDLRWDWIHLSHPQYTPEGHTVFEFVRWAARESGRTLRFDTPLVEQQSRGSPLHGMAAAAPVDVDFVLETTNYRAVQGDPFELVIGFAPVRPD